MNSSKRLVVLGVGACCYSYLPPFERLYGRAQKMAMRGRCGEPDLAVSRLPVAAQRLVPVDVRPARMGDGGYLPCWVGRWNPQPGIVHTVKVCT